MIQVVLKPIWAGGVRFGYLYDVLLDGEVIVSRASDPEHDAARALLAKGFIGSFETIDGKTGKPRMRIRHRDGGGALRRRGERSPPASRNGLPVSLGH